MLLQLPHCVGACRLKADTKLQSTECFVISGGAEATEVKSERKRVIGIALLARRSSTTPSLRISKAAKARKTYLLSRRSGDLVPRRAGCPLREASVS